jgi:hypothetical protein
MSGGINVSTSFIPPPPPVTSRIFRGDSETSAAKEVIIQYWPCATILPEPAVSRSGNIITPCGGSKTEVAPRTRHGPGKK